MTGTLILFSISIIGLVAMFWFKLHELKHGKTLYSESVRKSADNAVRKSVDAAANTADNIGKIPLRDLSIKAAGSVAKKVGDGAFHVYKKAVKKDNKIANFVKGKKVLVHREKTSDFLNGIEEHKRANGGGEIEG